MRLQTNVVADWIKTRAGALADDLEIKTVIQGDFTNLPAPDEIIEWANILLIKPNSNSIEESTVDGLYRVTYFFDVFFMREYNADEPINSKLVDATEALVEALFYIDEEEERFPDGSPIAEAYINRVDYDSDVEGLLRALDMDVTASKLIFLLIAEQ